MSKEFSFELSASEISDGVREGSLNPSSVVDATFRKAEQERIGPEHINAVLWKDEAGSKELASGIVKSSHTGALAGVPIAIKDNIATLSMPTTCGSKLLEGYVSPFEATVVSKLKAAGAIIAMKTNMDEFAMGSSTENSAWGSTLNPLDNTRVPGGSSGGSAAVVAAGVTRISLGSETGGSVRQPASFCGVVGVKPTYGRVSRHGLVAFASSLDQVGVFGRTVDDAALGLDVISGMDPLDSTSADVAVVSARSHKSASGPGSLKGLVIGLPKEYFPEDLDSGVREILDSSIDRLRTLGAEIRSVSLPHTALAIPVYYIIAPAEASSNLARFDGVRYGVREQGDGSLRGMYESTRSHGFGPEVIRRILLGTYVLSAGYYDAYYKKAMAVRELIANDFRTVFQSGVNALFTPTTPTVAFGIGSKADPYEMYMSDIFTVTANLAGVPAMSLPLGRISGLPVGGQIIAPHFEEPTMFKVAYALEDALGQEAHR